MTPTAPDKHEITPSKPPTSLMAATPVPEATAAFLAEIPEAQKAPPKIGRARIMHQDEQFVLPSGELVSELSGHCLYWWQDRQFYKSPPAKGQPGTPPDCYSLDMVEPTPSSREKQAKACAACRWNVFGSGRDGKSKGCREFINLAILNPEFGNPPLVILRLGPSSLKTIMGNQWNEPGFFYAAQNRTVQREDGSKGPIGAFQLVWATFSLRRAGELHCVVEYTLGDCVTDRDRSRQLAGYVRQFQQVFDGMRSTSPPTEGDE